MLHMNVGIAMISTAQPPDMHAWLRSYSYTFINYISEGSVSYQHVFGINTRS